MTELTPRTGEVKRRTGLGYLLGNVVQGIEVYKGIPYGKAPVGDLRFKPPVPYGGWDDVLDCREYRPNPIQFGKDPHPAYTEAFHPNEEAGFSEDCLHLNIYTDDAPGENKPVIVFFFGGGFVSGSANTMIYEAENMAYRGACVVTVNYRVGPLGFLTTPELREEQGTCGNYGLQDQLLALQWIRQNIWDYGGNGENVTVMGLSAGASCAEYLAISPAADGLIKRAFIESFYQIHRSIPTEEQAEERVAQGCPDGIPSLAELRAMPVEDLQKTFSGVRMWTPVIDGTIIPANTLDAYMSGKVPAMDMIFGVVSGDGPMASRFSMLELQNPVENAQDLRNLLNRCYGPMIAPKLGEYYLAPAKDDISKAVRDLKRDSLMQYGFMTARARAQHHKGRTFLYYMDTPIPGWEMFGTFHGSDILYWFDNLDTSLSACMATQLYQFAKLGTPNRASLPEWEPCEMDEIKFMVFDDADGIPHMEHTNIDTFWMNVGEDELDVMYRKGKKPSGEEN